MSELTTRIRAKFPGVYDDMDDAALEKAVLAKHPEYADLAQQKDDAQAAPAPKPDPFASARAIAGGAPAGELWANVKNHPVQAGAMIGSMALTGGAAGPLTQIARAGLGAAGGAGLGSIANAANGGTNGPTTAGGVAATMGKEGGLAALGEGAGQVVGRAVRATGSELQNAAESAYERMLKIRRAALEGMTDMGGTLQERSRNVAKTLLNDPNGQISKAGANAYGDATTGLLQKVDDLVAANPEARGSTQHLTDAMQGGRGTFQKQWAPSGDTSAYDRVAADVTSNPRVTKIKRATIDTSTEHALGLAPAESEVRQTGREMVPRVTASGARDLTRGTYRNLGDKAYGELKGAETEAQKAAARGGRAILNEAIPQVEPINNEISKRIDLGQVLDDAVFRSGKHDPVGLAERVILGGGHIAALPASLINRPGFGSPVARGLNRAGGALAGTKFPFNDALKTALIAALGGQD